MQGAKADAPRLDNEGSRGGEPGWRQAVAMTAGSAVSGASARHRPLPVI